MKSSLPFLGPLACAALGLPASAQDLVFTHPSGATTTFYGQFNPTYQAADDGTNTYDSVVDNSNSVSRLGFWVDIPMDGNKLRFNLETGLGLRTTADTNQGDDGDWIDWQRTDLRKIEAVYSGAFGAVWMGQGSMASDGAAEIDNSGTSVAAYVNLADTAAAFRFRDAGVLSDIRISDAFKDFDGGRRFRLRYDTPKFSGFTFSIAYGEEILAEDDDAQYYDAALRYAWSNDTIALDTALAYAWKNDDETTESLIASGTVLHKPSGLNLTLAAGSDQTGDASYYYAKFGWKGDVVSVGSTAVSFDWYDGSDFGVVGSSSQSWGIQAVQTFAEYNLEAYLGYRQYSYDEDRGTDYADIDVILVGARWKF